MTFGLIRFYRGPTTQASQIGSFSTSIPLATFNSKIGNGSVVNNSDGTTSGWTATGYSFLTGFITVPYDDIYDFSVTSFATTSLNYTTLTGANALQVTLDQTPIPYASGAAASSYFVALVTSTSPAAYTFTIPLRAGTHPFGIGMANAQASALGNNQGMHGDRVNVTNHKVGFPAEPAGSRDPWMFPLSANHILNTPLSPSTAVWSNTSDADNVSITSAPAVFNIGSFNQVGWQSNSSDGIGVVNFPNTNDHSVFNGGSAPQYIRLSGSASAAPGSDVALFVGSIDNPRYTYAGFNGSVTGSPVNSVTLNPGTMNDNYALNHSVDQDHGHWGMIRPGDLTQSAINHSILVGTQYTMMSSPQTTITGVQWPVNGYDFTPQVTSGPGYYTGTGAVFPGFTMGIPASQSMPSGLTNGGTILWNCLQKFGAIHNINAGNTSPALTLFCDYQVTQNTTTSSLAAGMNTDWTNGKIQPFLRILRNQSPSTPQGWTSGSASSALMIAGLQQGYPAIDPSNQHPPGGTPTKVVNAVYSFSSGTANSFASPVSQSSSVFILVNVNGDFGTTPQPQVTSVTDSKGNTYTLATQTNTSAPCCAAIYHSLRIPNALTTSDTVTVNFTGGTNGLASIVGYSMSGLTGSIDQAVNGFNQSSVQSGAVSSSTLTSLSSFVIGTLQAPRGASFPSLTEGLNGSELWDGTFNAASYTNLSTSTAVAYSCSWTGGSTPYSMAMAVYKY